MSEWDMTVKTMQPQGKPQPERKTVAHLTRDCVAALVPAGSRIVLQKNTEVIITQDLGNSYTISVFGNLARIESKDADALGMEAVDPLADLDPDASLEDKAWALLRSCYDPEIPVNIVELGLIYDVVIAELDKSPGNYRIDVNMTLTAPGCGMGPVMLAEVEDKLRSLEQVVEVEVNLVFDPPWDQSMMSEAAQLQLGLF